MLVRPLIFAPAVLMLATCAPNPRAASFDSDHPDARAAAIVDAAAREDRSAIPRIVEQLASDDPLVRVVAIDALDRLTGDRHGYDPHAPKRQRAEAIDRWVEAVRSGRFETGDQAVRTTGGDDGKQGSNEDQP